MPQELETKEALDKFMSAFDEYKKENDAVLKELKDNRTDPIGEEKLAKIDSFLDKYEDINQRLTKSLELAKSASEDGETWKGELKKRLDEFETVLNRAGTGEDKAGDAKERLDAWAKSTVKAIQFGQQSLSEDELKSMTDVTEEYKALNMSTNTEGGYLTPIEMIRDIIKDITEISPVRSIAKVRQTASRAVEIPKRTGQFAAQWVAEQGTKDETEGLTYGVHEITTHEMYALIDITNQLLEDSMFDMAGEIMSEAAEQFALAEGTAFVKGNGVTRPEGFMTHADVPTVNSGVADDIVGKAMSDGTASQGDGLLRLKYALKTGYKARAQWLMKRSTIGRVRRMVDGEGRYLWMPGIAQGRPNTIDSDPYTEMPDMDTIAENAYPVAYGDFRKAYCWLDRIQMEMLRDPYTQATGGKIRYILRKRVGGKVVLPEAIVKMKCAVNT